MKNLLLIAVLLCASCATDPLPAPDWPRVFATANTLRTDVNSVVSQLNTLKIVALDMCPVVGSVAGYSSASCDRLKRMFELAGGLLKVSRSSIDAFEATGVAGKEVADSVTAVHAAVAGIESAIREMMEVGRGPSSNSGGNRDSGGDGAGQPVPEGTSGADNVPSAEAAKSP